MVWCVGRLCAGVLLYMGECASSVWYVLGCALGSQMSVWRICVQACFVFRFCLCCNAW